VGNGTRGVVVDLSDGRRLGPPRPYSPRSTDRRRVFWKCGSSSQRRVKNGLAFRTRSGVVSGDAEGRMDEKELRAEADAEARRDSMVYWKAWAGSPRSGGPLSRVRAESLVRVYREISPQRGYRVEPVPRELEVLQLGRIARHRRLARKGT